MWDIDSRTEQMLEENEMATGGQLYPEKPAGNSRDTIPIRPATDQVLYPPNTQGFGFSK